MPFDIGGKLKNELGKVAKILNFDNIKNNIANIHESAVEKVKDFAKTALIATAAFATFMLKSLDDIRAKTIETFGMATPALQDIVNSTRSIFVQTVALGVEIEEVVETFSMLSQIIGTMDTGQLETMTKEAILFQMAIGLSIDDSIDLTRSLKRQGITANQAYNIANKAAIKFGVSTGKILSDLTSMGDEMDELLAFDIKKLIQAAAVSNDLGLALSDSVTTLKEFSDLSSGIETAMKINVLAGTNLNAELLYMANLTGDIEKATRHIAKNLGASDFLNLEIGIQRMIASNLSLTVNQLITMVEAYKTGNKEIGKIARQREKLNTLETLAMQKMGSINMLWAQLKSVALEALEPIIVQVSKALDFIIKIQSGISEWSIAWKGLTTVGVFSLSLLVLWMTKLGVIYVARIISSKLLTASFFQQAVATNTATTALSKMGTVMSKGAGSLFSPKTAIGIGVVTLAIMGLGKAISMAGDGIEKMSRFGSENVATLSQLPMLLFQIGNAAIVASIGMATFNKKTQLASSLVRDFEMTKQQKPLELNYTKLKQIMKEAFKESEISATLNNFKIESTPVFVNNKKMADIVHAAIRSTQ